jgi:hypothetical protein
VIPRILKFRRESLPEDMDNCANEMLADDGVVLRLDSEGSVFRRDTLNHSNEGSEILDVCRVRDERAGQGLLLFPRCLA